jgi:hypothetical protein
MASSSSSPPIPSRSKVSSSSSLEHSHRSRPPSLFGSSHTDSEGDVEETPAPKRQKERRAPWLPPVKDYFAVQATILRDIGAECPVCMQLPTDCAMLRSCCPCRALMCFKCFGHWVKRGAIGADPPNRVSCGTVTDFLSLGSENLLVFTLYSCPTCQVRDVGIFPIDTKEWSSLRQLYSSVKSSIDSKDLVRATPLKLTCGSHFHDSDKAWAECKDSSFDLLCPAKDCGQILSLRTNGGFSVRTQVRCHLLAEDKCTGVVECPYCSPRVSQGKWYSTLRPSQVKQHYELHLKLMSLWLQFHTTTPNFRQWWTAVCIMFKDLDPAQPFGGAATFMTNSPPLSRLVNAINPKKTWTNPWMDLFLDGMRSQHKLNSSMTHMFEVSFAMLFNSAFQMREDEDDDDDDEVAI